MKNTTYSERLFEIELPLVRDTSYGCTIFLEKVEAKSGKYLLRSIDHTCDHKQAFFYDTLDEALIDFKHWCVDITSDMELKEDGSIGYYPKKQETPVYIQPSLFENML